MAAREYVYIVQESAFGTPVASPTVGTNALFIRLDGANAYSMRMKPKRWQIQYGGGNPTVVATGADEYETKGSLKTQLYPSQAALLLNWAGLPINTAQTSPWTTTEPAGDLASCSVYHLTTHSDGSVRRRWTPGVKVSKWGLAASRQDPVFKLSLDLVGIKDDGNAIDGNADPTTSVFPAPTEAQYPTGPYVFSQLAGGLILGNAGAARSQFESFALDVEHALDPRCYESQFPLVTRFLGRSKTTLKAKLNYKPAPDDRVAFEQVTTQTCQATITSGAHSVALNFKSNNVWDDVDDDFQLDKQFLYTLSMMNMFDPANGTDFTLAVA